MNNDFTGQIFLCFCKLQRNVLQPNLTETYPTVNGYSLWVSEVFISSINDKKCYGFFIHVVKK